MSDRCYLQIKCRRSDLARYWPGWMSHVDDHCLVMTYGSSGEIEELPDLINLFWSDVDFPDYGAVGVPKELPFIGENGTAGNYGACESVHDGTDATWCGGEGLMWQRASHDAGYVFDIDKAGLPIVPEEWREWWSARERVSRYLYEGGAL